MNNTWKKLAVAATAASLLGSGIATEQHEHAHPHFAKDIDAFHSVLAPVWHAPQGKQRDLDTCSAAERMATLAKDIRSIDASGLQASVAALKARCGEGAVDIEGPLFEVHEAFHRLIMPKTGA